MQFAPNFTPPSLSKLYSENYDSTMIEWRRLGAIDKSQNIRTLLGRETGAKIETVLEVGCGTGHVLVELARSGFAKNFVGIEIGAERGGEADTAGLPITIQSYDGAAIPFPDSSFDLVYATHVLEHVPDERGFLHQLRRTTRKFVYIEVPLELHIRSSVKHLQHTLQIGHINSYTMESFALTLETSGLKIIDMELFDFSLPRHKFHSSYLKALPKMLLRRTAMSINKRLSSKLFTYHCGALCRPAAMLDW